MTHHRTLLSRSAALGLCLFALSACSPEPLDVPPNIILVLTDDQRWDTLWAMPRFMERSSEHQLLFHQAFVSTPMCAPSRGCILSGGFYAHNAHVLTNELPNGSWSVFPDDEYTLSVLLQSQGYRTGLLGKYLNPDGEVDLGIPRGWNTWWVPTERSHMVDWQVVSGVSDGGGEDLAELSWGTEYFTDAQADKAIHFMEEREEPFFLYLSTTAPHLPNEPAPQDIGLFQDFNIDLVAYNEEDVSDKPAFIQETPPLDAQEQETIARRAENQLLLLQPVDRMMERIMDQIEEQGIADRTYIFFMSDNGILWGEHRLRSKGVPYDPAIRVPLVVWAPDIEPAEREDLVAANLDVPATLLALAGIEGRTEGVDILEPLRDETAPKRDRMLIQSFTQSSEFWSGVLTERWKYVRWGTKETELYDRQADPHELQNLSAVLPPDFPREDLLPWLQQAEGLTLPIQTLPRVKVGSTLDVEVPIWGGQGPFTWQVVHIPQELTFRDGWIRGTVRPHTVEDYVSLRILDSSVTPWDQGRQSFQVAMRFVDVPR